MKEKLKQMGAIFHEEHKDKLLGKRGTPKRDMYEKELANELLLFALRLEEEEKNKVYGIEMMGEEETEKQDHEVCEYCGQKIKDKK